MVDYLQLTTTQRQILLGLLLANKPVTISELAHAVDVNPNTVARQLDLVACWIERCGYCLDQANGDGISVNASDRTKRRLLSRLANESSDPSLLVRDERRALLTFIIHIAEEPLISRQLQNCLHVSRSTILKDLAAVAKWYEAHDLFLIRRPNYGIKLKGKESDWRRVLVEMIMAHFDEPVLLRLCNGGELSTSAVMFYNPPLADRMLGYLRQLPLVKARELVRVAEARLKTRFIDADHLVLTLHVALLMKRLDQGHVVELDSGQLQALSEQPVYPASCELAQLIEDEISSVVPEREIGHLCIQFLGSKLDNRATSNLPADARFLAEAVLRRAGALLSYPLDTDHELLNRLAAHLAPALQRLRLNLPVHNPLLDEIRSRYSEVYKIAETASSAIRDYLRTDVPADEVAYIAMYLAGALVRRTDRFLPKVLIVCPSGSATSWLLHSRLQTEFPDIPVLDILSARDLSRGVPSKVDLIISTVPLPQVEVPTVVVSALLGRDDVKRIELAVTELSHSILEKVLGKPCQDQAK